MFGDKRCCPCLRMGKKDRMIVKGYRKIEKMCQIENILEQVHKIEGLMKANETAREAGAAVENSGINVVARVDQLSSLLPSPKPYQTMTQPVLVLVAVRSDPAPIKTN